MLGIIAAARRWTRRKGSSDPLEALREALAVRYRIEARLGEGGMADVWLAEDLRHGRAVAIKVLKHELAASVGHERFLSEIRLTAQLRHPNILPLFDSGEAAGALYYVMPHVEGESLAERLAREPRLPLGEAVRIVRDVSEALEYAHERGVIHRDIKPGNLLLEHGHAVVADFGIARALCVSCPKGVADSGGITETGTAVGSPHYMSPEQATGRYEVDGRSDLYSLACVAYEMLAGGPPFTGPTTLAILARHAIDPVPPLEAVRPGISARVVGAIERALAKMPAERFPSVGAFAEALATAERPAVVLPVGPRSDGTPPGGVPGVKPSVAVLPFLDLCDDCEQAFFVAGMHDAVIAELAKVGALTVISRTTMLRYAGTRESLSAIASELGVAAVLEGSVLRSGSRLRITLQLVRGADEERLWTGTYERELTDVLALHAEVARSVAEAVHARLTEEEEARLGSVAAIDPKVYELYLRGRYLSAFVPDEAQRAVRYFEQAVDLAPDFAPAYSALARRYGWLASFGLAPGPDVLPRAMAAAARAAELDPESADALAALGYLRHVVDWDPCGAREALERALELEPGNLEAITDYALVLCTTGRHEETERAIRRIVELDPFSPTTALHVGWCRFLARRFDESAEHLTAEAGRHAGFAYLPVFAGLAEVMRGNVGRAIELGRLADAKEVASKNLDFLNALSALYAFAGREAEARAVIARAEAILGGEDGAWFRWLARLILGDEAEAVRWFDLAFEQRNPMLVLMPVHPIFEPARRHPYMRERIRAMGIVEELPEPFELPREVIATRR